MDEIGGLPVHPLVVHLPVVLLPLAAVAAILLVIRKSWYERFRWVTLIICGIGTAGAFLATQSGEELEGEIRRNEGAAAVRGIGDHSEAGDAARTVAILFFLVLLAYVVIPWWMERRKQEATTAEATQRTEPTWLRPLLMALVVLTAVMTTAAVFKAGHSGAEQVWDEGGDDDGGGASDEDSMSRLIEQHQVVVTPSHLLAGEAA